MRYLALALAICFVTAPMEAATRRTASVHPVKVKKNKKAPRARKAKKPTKHAA